jgi:hypothetical protein
MRTDGRREARNVRTVAIEVYFSFEHAVFCNKKHISVSAQCWPKMGDFFSNRKRAENCLVRFSFGIIFLR